MRQISAVSAWDSTAFFGRTQIMKLPDALGSAFQRSAFFKAVANAEITKDCQNIEAAELTLLVHVIDEPAGLGQIKLYFTACHRLSFISGKGALASIVLGRAALNGGQDQNNGSNNDYTGHIVLLECVALPGA